MVFPVNSRPPAPQKIVWGAGNCAGVCFCDRVCPTPTARQDEAGGGRQTPDHHTTHNPGGPPRLVPHTFRAALDTRHDDQATPARPSLDASPAPALHGSFLARSGLGLPPAADGATENPFDTPKVKSHSAIDTGATPFLSAGERAHRLPESADCATSRADVGAPLPGIQPCADVDRR